ncbi:Cystathionine beta-lyase [compost metagenome]
MAAERFVDSLQLFGIGASWGGFESLAVLADMRRARSVTDWSEHGQVIRLHIGLEGVGDLLADLEQAFAAIADIGNEEGDNKGDARADAHHR